MVFLNLLMRFKSYTSSSRSSRNSDSSHIHHHHHDHLEILILMAVNTITFCQSVNMAHFHHCIISTFVQRLKWWISCKGSNLNVLLQHTRISYKGSNLIVLLQHTNITNTWNIHPSFCQNKNNQSGQKHQYASKYGDSLKIGWSNDKTGYAFLAKNHEIWI